MPLDAGPGAALLLVHQCLRQGQDRRPAHPSLPLAELAALERRREKTRALKDAETPNRKNPIDMKESRSRLPNRVELQKFFAGTAARLSRCQQFSLSPSHSQLDRFFNSVLRHVVHAEAQQRQRDLSSATKFNMFDLIDPDENKLSDILADLLNPRGTHGQGNLFLRLLINQLNLELSTEHTNHAIVQREAPTHGIRKYRRRIDVLVDTGDLLAIENKVDSPELPDQVADYLAHLAYCSRHSGKRGVLIYLTPNGRRPDSLSQHAQNNAEATGHLRCWSYQTDLSKWLERCRDHCRAGRMINFLADFIDYIQSNLRRSLESELEHETDEN